jgi:hypothetical protein
MSKMDTLTLRHKHFDGKVCVVLNQSRAAQLAARLFPYVGFKKEEPSTENKSFWEPASWCCHMPRSIVIRTLSCADTLVLGNLVVSVGPDVGLL